MMTGSSQHSYKVSHARGPFSRDVHLTPNSHFTGPSNHYYLSFPHSLSSSWDMALHEGSSRHARKVATIRKAGLFHRDGGDIEVKMHQHGWGDNKKGVMKKKGVWRKSHRFEGVYGGRFEWRKQGHFSSTLTCIDLNNGRTAAKWSRSYAPGREGKLSIVADYSYMLEHLIATGLAAEKWRAEQRTRNAVVASSANV